MVYSFSIQGDKRLNEKPLPDLPPPTTTNSNSSKKGVLNKFLFLNHKFSLHLERISPRVARYKTSILITIGLLILTSIIVIIIVVTVGGHKGQSNGTESDAGGNLGGEGYGTYYGNRS